MVTGIVTLDVIIGNEMGLLEFVNFVQFPFLLGIEAGELH